jgi:endonuclease/exonuclease/phosphatase family metal-dependent hydrolase
VNSTPIQSNRRRFFDYKAPKAKRRHPVGLGEAEGDTFRIVTYNIHKCRGLDGRVRPQRIVEILREIDADLIALQEVWNKNMGLLGPKEANQPLFIAEELKFYYAFGENRQLKGGGYGNVILSRFPLTIKDNLDLSQSRKEERGCLRTDIALSASRVLHVFNIHLGTAYLERRRQVSQLLESEILTGSDINGPRILLGDFNEWLPGLTLRLLREHFGKVDFRAKLDRRRTYPGAFPFLYLDHIYFDDSLELKQAMAYRTRKALLASDHIPLVADFHLKPSCHGTVGPWANL